MNEDNKNKSIVLAITLFICVCLFIMVKYLNAANQTTEEVMIRAARNYASERYHISPDNVMIQNEFIHGVVWFSIPVNNRMHWFICMRDQPSMCFERVR